MDYQAAVNQYQIAADQMVPQAVFNLGYMHEHGLGLQMVCVYVCLVSMYVYILCYNHQMG